MHSSRMRTASLRIVPGGREVLSPDPGGWGGEGGVVTWSWGGREGGVVTWSRGGREVLSSGPGGGREVLSRDLWCCTPPPPPFEQNE